MGAVNYPKPSTDNIIQLTMIDGKLNRKPKVRLKKDGTVDRRRCNKVAGVSSEVYPFTTEEEIKTMVDVFNKRIEKLKSDVYRKTACRNKMLFLIGINLSLRISDLLTLRWNFFFEDDMSFKKSYKIQPKKTRATGKFVTLYFNEVIKKAITEYIEQYPIKDMNDFVFENKDGGKAITEKSAWRIIDNTAKEAGLTMNYGTHSLRKTFGYHVWHNSEDKEESLVLLMAIFNHSSIVDTKKYIGLMSEDIEEVFDNLNLGLDLFD